MKSIICVTLFIVLFMADIHALLADTVLTKHDDDKTIVVNSGTVIEIQLEEKGSAGYSWEFDKLNNKYFEFLNVETKNIVRKEGYTGNPILKIWHLKARQKGTAELTMYYYRPWEDKNKAVDRFHIKFKIM